MQLESIQPGKVHSLSFSTALSRAAERLEAMDWWPVAFFYELLVFSLSLMNTNINKNMWVGKHKQNTGCRHKHTAAWWQEVLGEYCSASSMLIFQPGGRSDVTLTYWSPTQSKQSSVVPYSNLYMETQHYQNRCATQMPSNRGNFGVLALLKLVLGPTGPPSGHINTFDVLLTRQFYFTAFQAELHSCHLYLHVFVP